MSEGSARITCGTHSRAALFMTALPEGSMMTDLTQFARLDSSLLHTRLLAGARQVGGIYQLDYQHALISTDAKWKADAGGIALPSFLLATVMPIDGVSDCEDEEVLLLRVDDTCQLPRQAEL